MKIRHERKSGKGGELSVKQGFMISEAGFRKPELIQLT